MYTLSFHYSSVAAHLSVLTLHSISTDYKTVTQQAEKSNSIKPKPSRNAVIRLVVIIAEKPDRKWSVFPN